jgi:hypothetical protein
MCFNYASYFKGIGLAASLALLTLAVPCYAQEQARSADDFVDYVGVNTHLGQTVAPYANYLAVKSALINLGVRHIREGGLPPFRASYISEMKNLAATGIHTDLMLDGNWYPDGPGGYPDGYGATHINPAEVVSMLNSLAPAIDAIEGVNESNGNSTFKYLGNGFPQGTIAYDRDMFLAVKSSPRTRKIPVILSSVADTEGTTNVYARMTAFSPGPANYIDYGNIHIYPGADKPSYPGPWWPESIDWQLNAALGTQSAPGIAFGKPIIVTESGYENYNDQWQISERGAGIYIPRLLFEYFNRNVKRCYIYELIDEQAQAGKEAHWGIMRSDLTPKPAYTALRNIIGILSDHGSAFRLQKLSLNITAPSTVHHTLLQKRDGTFYLVLWNEVDSYKPSLAGGSDVFNQLVSVTIGCLNANLSSVYSPDDDTGQKPTTEYTKSLSTGTITLDVPDQTLILRIPASNSVRSHAAEHH